MPVGGDGSNPSRPSPARNKLWAQDATAEIEFLKAKSRAISTRLGQLPTVEFGQTRQEAQAIYDAVENLLALATAATCGERPKYRRVLSWWTGNCVEAAFRNIHNAEATLAALYDNEQARAEIPEAVRRALESLSPNDPMRSVARKLRNSREKGDAVALADLSKLIEAGHAAADRQRSRLRTFRNVLISGIFVTTLLLLTLIVLVSWRPSLVPLCFVQNPPPPDPNLPNIACPVKAVRELDLTNPHTGSSRFDFLIVALLGLMGGALSASLFLRDLYSNSTPYNVTVPLALLKLPAGAMTALTGIILLAGEFVPGFSAIDKPAQILAYAVVFGFAQQLFTQFVDQRAQKLVDSVTTKTAGASNAGRNRPISSAEAEPDQDWRD